MNAFTPHSILDLNLSLHPKHPPKRNLGGAMDERQTRVTIAAAVIPAGN